MKKCPKCGSPGRKAFGGYCTRVHRDLDRAGRIVHTECATCGTPLRRTASRISAGGRSYCGRCPKNGGENHGRWKEGQYIDAGGYRLVLIQGSYKREHIHTWEQENSACILPSARGILHIHHINMVKTDNRPENLVALSNEIHGRIHRFIDAARFEEAKWLLIQACEQQAFFLQHTEHIERIRSSFPNGILRRT